MNYNLNYRPMELRLVHNIHLQIQICHQETKVGVAQEDVVETQQTSISSYMHTMNLSNPNFTFFRQLLYFIKHLHMCTHTAIRLMNHAAHLKQFDRIRFKDYFSFY